VPAAGIHLDKISIFTYKKTGVLLSGQSKIQSSVKDNFPYEVIFLITAAPLEISYEIEIALPALFTEKEWR